jgi:hypothetical protein
MATGNHSSSDDGSRDQRLGEEIESIQEALRGLRFGSINVIVQDGVIVQIDRTEKKRIRRAKPLSPSSDDCR